MKKYVLVEWPESQELMEHERFNECLFVQDIDGHVEAGGSAYMCPEDLYEKIFNIDNIESKRIGNLMFRKATYLGEEPEFPAWHIDFFYPNPYYGKENEYIKDKDFYIKDKNSNHRIHKDCFKHKESCYSIASFGRDGEGFYELSFIGDRPLGLNEKDMKDFWELVKYGYHKLNVLIEND
jgi:hypothetical protein